MKKIKIIKIDDLEPLFKDMVENKRRLFFVLKQKKHVQIFTIKNSNKYRHILKQIENTKWKQVELVVLGSKYDDSMKLITDKLFIYEKYKKFKLFEFIYDIKQMKTVDTNIGTVLDIEVM